MTKKSNRLKALAVSVNKRLGDKEFMGIVTDNELAGRISGWVTTGNLALDYCCSGKLLGGGFPAGRVIEIFGPPATGKTLLLYHFLTETQKRGGLAVLLETEGAYNRDFGATIGINNDELLWAEPDTIEQVFQVIEEIADEAQPEDELITIVWDSLAQTSTEHEMEMDFSKVDSSMEGARKAKMIKAGFRRIGRKIGKANILLVTANHTIAKIGVLYGKKTTTSGGEGYNFASSIRLELKKGKSIFDVATKEAIGTHAKIFVEKNKVAFPFKECEIEIYFAHGANKYSGFLDVLVNKGIIEQKGGWYSLGEEKFRSADFAEFFEVHKEEIVNADKKEEQNGE